MTNFITCSCTGVLFLRVKLGLIDDFLWSSVLAEGNLTLMEVLLVVLFASAFLLSGVSDEKASMFEFVLLFTWLTMQLLCV